MDAYEVGIANWLKTNGLTNDPSGAKALYSALDQPGDYGALKVVRDGDTFTVTGPAGALSLTGAEDIQAFRLRLEEIINHPTATRA